MKPTIYKVAYIAQFIPICKILIKFYQNENEKEYEGRSVWWKSHPTQTATYCPCGFIMMKIPYISNKLMIYYVVLFAVDGESESIFL